MQAHLPDEWPDAPEITSEAAILVDIDTDTILYAKNATSSMYPASTTKLMTAYLTLSNTSLDDIVTFSKNSIYSLPSGSSHIGMHIGESLSVRDCLYGLLLPSANEVATALAEHVSGSVSSFVELMNSTAVSLGCVNTNFANANGLQDPNHMTCAYDLYRIMLGCLQYSDFISISSTPAYYKRFRLLHTVCCLWKNWLDRGSWTLPRYVCFKRWTQFNLRYNEHRRSKSI